jgi:hypothetical protein
MVNIEAQIRESWEAIGMKRGLIYNTLRARPLERQNKVR